MKFTVVHDKIKEYYAGTVTAAPMFNKSRKAYHGGLTFHDDETKISPVHCKSYCLEIDSDETFRPNVLPKIILPDISLLIDFHMVILTVVDIMILLYVGSTAKTAAMLNRACA